MFRGFKLRKKVQLMFSRAKDSMKGKRCVFRDSKQRIKVLLMFLGFKVLQKGNKEAIVYVFNV